MITYTVKMPQYAIGGIKAWYELDLESPTELTVDQVREAVADDLIYRIGLVYQCGSEKLPDQLCARIRAAISIVREKNWLYRLELAPLACVAPS
jgi:hypothetical protein